MAALMARVGSRIAVLGLASLALASGACIKDDTMPALSALCTPDVNNSLNCGSQPDGGAPTSMVGHICPKGSRPDMDPHYNENVPQGLVCGEQGPPGPDGSQGWCCTPKETTCAYNPVSTCPVYVFNNLLSPGQVVSPDHVVPATQGSGTAMTAFNDRASSVYVTGSFSNLSSTATAAHIHASAGFGENADVVITLIIPANVTSGGISGPDPATTPPLTAEQMQILRSGQSYIDVHTVNFPDGEIRGQVQNSFNGFQCRGSDRPEALNPLVDCGNGVREKDFINFCCTSRPIPPPPLGPGCVQSDGQCTGKKPSWLPDRMSGWTCTDGAIPAAEDFKANESRADFFYFLCATPRPAPNPRVEYYCCYVPALIQPGGSCISDLYVPACEENRFGFSCYGRDRPEQTYDVMTCDQTPVNGVNADGFAAKQYCCDMKACVLQPQAQVPGCVGNKLAYACYGDRPEHQWPLVTCPDPPVQGLSAEGSTADLYCCDPPQ